MPSWKRKDAPIQGVLISEEGIGFLFAYSLLSSPAKKFAFHSSWNLLFYLFSLL